MIDIYLIRHAESEMNKKADLVGGRSNETPLTTKGLYQAKLLGERLKDSNITFDKFYSSTAKRTIETANAALSKLEYSIDDVLKTQELLELDQGDWEGKERTKIYTPKILNQINNNNWNFTPPNGESQKMVEDRMYGWIKENLLSKHSEITAGIFTHGMGIKCLLRKIMDFAPEITYKITLNNTSITNIKHDNKGWHIISINDDAHLLNVNYPK